MKMVKTSKKVGIHRHTYIKNDDQKTLRKDHLEERIEWKKSSKKGQTPIYNFILIHV